MPSRPWAPAEAHRLQPDHHPTPFSAAQIRAAIVVGREVRSLHVRAGAEPYVHVVRNLGVDGDTSMFEVWTETPAGDRITEPKQGTSTFLELQRHASMPILTTMVEAVEVEIPLGRFDGLCYTRAQGDNVDTFWFARARPGAPVRFEFRVGGEVVFSSTSISERLPGSPRSTRL